MSRQIRVVFAHPFFCLKRAGFTASSEEHLTWRVTPAWITGGFKPVKRFGVTVVELLVALAGLSIVATILLPAIQSARECARAENCADRLTRIVLESHVYDTIHGQLPMFMGAKAGVDYFDTININNPNYYGWQQSASPLALAASTSTEFDIDPDFFDYTTTLQNRGILFWQLPGWIELSKQQLPRYRCPSNSRLAKARPVAGYILAAQSISYNGSVDWISLLFDSSPTSTYGITNYVGCFGATAYAEDVQDLPWHYRGMITSRGSVSIEQVQAADGLSNSIMYGENIGDIRASSGASSTTAPVLWYGLSWMSGAIATRGRGLAPWLENGTFELPLLGNGFRSSPFGFGSFHPDGVNFAMGDGSVQRVARFDRLGDLLFDVRFV